MITPEIIRGISKRVAQQEIDLARLVSIISTADDTVTVLLNITTDSYEVGLIEYKIIGIKNDGLTAFATKRVFRYVNDGTTLTIGTATDLFTDSDFTTATVDEVASGIEVLIRVTGEAATNIIWKGEYQQTKITTEVLPP